MKHKLIIPVLAAAAAGLFAFGLARHAVCRAAGPGLDCLSDVSFLTRKLGLTDPQAEEIKALHTALGVKLNDFCERHCAARARLAQALASSTNGDAPAEAALAEMCRAYEDSEQATLTHIRQMRAILTPGQLERFDAMITESMCGKCNMPGGVPASCEAGGRR